MQQEGQQIKGLSTDTIGPFDQVPVRKKRKRLPSLERLRNELFYQLRESLRASQKKMNNPELTLAERHHWTQTHTYTAQVLTTILRDLLGLVAASSMRNDEGKFRASWFLDLILLA